MTDTRSGLSGSCQRVGNCMFLRVGKGRGIHPPILFPLVFPKNRSPLSFTNNATWTKRKPPILLNTFANYEGIQANTLMKIRVAISREKGWRFRAVRVAGTRVRVAGTRAK